MTKPLILGFDTSASHCAAALLRDDLVLCAVGEEMAKGQAERLMTLLTEVLESQNTRWQDLSALAVGVGPGNFTGIRIGVSAARGLALGLSIPAYGVTGFSARARLSQPGQTVAIPAPRGMAYTMVQGTPRTVQMDDVCKPAPNPSPADLAVAVARHAQNLWPEPAAAPAPYYIRPPDAAPAKDIAPKVL